MSSTQGSVAGSRPSTSRNHPLPKLLPEQRSALHQAACHWLAQTALRQPASSATDCLGNLSEMLVHGAFVTLRRGDSLRGCCGVLGTPMQLGIATQQAAARTILEDQRMAPVSPTELPYLDVDVTLLGPMEAIAAEGAQRAAAIEIGKHGLAIQQGDASGLLLPDVATERNWSAEQFLQAVCRKAGLPTDAWKHSAARVMTFAGQAVSGPFDGTVLGDSSLILPAPLTKDELGGYVQLAANNITLLAQGATPSYYASQLPDMNVHAIILSMQWGSEEDIRQGNAIHVSVRPGVPLQSTLFQMCQSMAQILVRQRYLGQFQVGLTIGYDPAFHGQSEEVDIAGVDTQSRGFVINDARHCAAIFAPGQPAPQLLEQLRNRLPIGSKYGLLHSMQFISSLQELVATTLPVAQRGTGTRQPAVAGMFYPAEDAARRSMVEELCRHPLQSKQPALAIMVPHAGLKYSGAVAARAWQSVAIPETVIIISPKHTQAGVNWAVSPWERWKLSGSVGFAGDPELAKLLVEKIPGLQMDVAAHEKEHGIEVQLPILERVAPTTKVVGLAIHGGVWSEIDAAAAGLADALRTLPTKPLLVISSDMNHFADDAENRRLDRLALDALLTGDPKKLLDTCMNHQISMCGVIPAALVMATLQKLGHHVRVQELSYATSAEAGGDKSRVVGYAGALLT